MAPAFQVTRGRMAAKQAHALRAGARVSATLVAVTGPKSHVTGASTRPTSGPDVLERRLAPWGTITTVAKKTLCRCAMAQAGQAMNQTSWAGSPQPQVSADEGWPDQTCHHRMMAGNVKQARATTWKPMVRDPLNARLWPARWRGGTATADGPAGSVWLGMASGTGCVDTSIPLVTAAERTAALSGAKPGDDYSYDRQRVRHPTMHRDRCRSPRALERLGSEPARLAC